MKRVLLFIVRFYRQWISPVLPGSCRFAPSCSEYALTAITRYGSLKGFLMTAGRIARCHPFHPGGYDPVPEPENSTGFGIILSRYDHRICPDSGPLDLDHRGHCHSNTEEKP